MFKGLWNFLLPPVAWRAPVLFMVAVLIGISIYAFYVSRAYSYLSDDPKTCVNCHVMQSEFATWQHSSHREAATCNDCHVPHTSIAAKYFFKAKDGLGHATAFTMRSEPQVIKIKEAGIEVVQANCIRCHTELNTDVGLTKVNRERNLHGDGKLCWECHREVPHGRVKGLNTTPHARVPLPGSPIPNWLQKASKK